MENEQCCYDARFGEASHPGPRNMGHPSKIVLMLNDCTELMKIMILWGVVLWLYLIFSYFRLSNAANGTRFGEASHQDLLVHH